MNEIRTISILQRVPVILAVTAASYGLPLQSRGPRQEMGVRNASAGPAASGSDGPTRKRLVSAH
jgi:hypothetical protein